MKTAPPIADLLGQPGIFYRSVALERDAADSSAGTSFVLTPWLERGAAEILAGMRAGSTRRAWRIIGDLGVGKSALALAIVQALDPRISSTDMPMRQLANRLGDTPRMFPLIVVGSRAGLAAGLTAAIENVIEISGLLDASWAKTIRAVSDPFDAIISLREALRSTGRFDGLLLIIDEMGKFLEAAGEEEGFDVFRLQSLAETAARSGDARLGIILILHKGFQSYAEDWRVARRSEWEKVAERFEEMIFDHPLSHTASLLAAALAVNAAALPARTRKSHDTAVATVRALGWLGPRNAAGAAGCWPVHPAAIPVMARFFASFGQNERSLFGFGASEEPNGLRAFAADTSVGTDLYGIPDFFDYIASSFGHRLTSRAGAGEWDRISAVFDRASESDETEIVVLKTIGTLNLLDAPDLAATDASVRAALAPRFDSQAVNAALARLVAGGMVFRRPGRPELRLWTSRRVDLSAIWDEAECDIDARDVVKHLPRHLSALPIRPHVLARRHSVTTGTNRRFAVRCTHASSLAGHSGHGDADGGVVAIICGGKEDLSIARAWSAGVTSNDDTMLAIVVPPMSELGKDMVELLRHRWVVGNASALSEDAYAAAEIERTTADLEAQLVTAVEVGLGLRGHAPTAPVEAFHGGERAALDAPVHAFVSNLCDRLFHAAPVVENELVNRHTLTSAGAGARQRLIERMFANASEADLGFTPQKNPPEKAMYLSLLKRGRVHRDDGDGFVVAPPPADDDPLRLRPALDKIESRLATGGERVPLSELYAQVEAQPYGVRRGLVPLLLAVTLVAAGHRVALFERGSYCTKIDGAAFMRILKSPEHFELQWVSLEGVRADVFQRLAVILKQPLQAAGIRAVVDPLIRFGVSLSYHVQHASSLSENAKAVRRALQQARSPIELLFNELPLACGAEPFGPDAKADAGRAAAFAARLDEAVTELRSCYPRLLEGIRTGVLAVLGAPDRTALAERAAPLGFRVSEQRLKTFAMRLADAAVAEDPWAEALGGTVVGKPPSRWRDQDVDAWRERLEELAGQFARVEAAAFGNGSSKRKAVRLSLTKVDGRERAVVVDIGQLAKHQVEAMGIIARVATEADLSFDTVVALLSLDRMDREADTEVDAQPLRGQA